MLRPAIEIVSPGARATFQDVGRPGYRALGVSPSGAADRAAHRLANRLVGNHDTAVSIECVLGGLVFRALRPVRLAVSGAPRAVFVDDRAAPMHAPFDAPAGAEVRIATGPEGVYTYIGVAGGVVAEAVLGSCATDALSGIGPAPLAAGDVFTVGVAVGTFAAVDVAPVPRSPDPLIVRITAGPRLDWFDDDALERLCMNTYTATALSNRVAVRLDGAALVRAAHCVGRELPSEGLVRGAIQIPPDGLPVVMGPDHPTTGGYPVIAVVVDRDADRVMQLAPGTAVRFARTR